MTRDASEPDDGDADAPGHGGSPPPADGADSAPTDVRPRTDGGTDTEGADDVALDPWGSSTVADYRKLFEQFGIEQFDEVLPEVPDPHYLMRRGVIFGHREYDRVAQALQTGDDVAALSGFMPTGDPHIGHKMVFDEIIWHQQQGADAYALIADLEAHSARGLSWEEIDEHTRNYLLSLLALGFDPEEGELYRQSTNRAVQDLAFELGVEANFSELQAIYDFDGETDVSHMQSVVTQMADILYPQLDEPKPTVIPVGPDQDPHMRLARDLAARMRFFKVTEAYASFELEDDERAVVAQAYDRLDGEIDSIRCEDAAELLQRASELYEAVDNLSSLSEQEFGLLVSEADSIADLRDKIDHTNVHENVFELLDVMEVVPPVVVTPKTFEAVIKKLENAGKEPLRSRTRFLDRNATDEAFDALVEAIDGEKRRYEGHVDAFDLDPEEAEELAREIEVENGGYGFIAPSSIYHRFMTGLTGGKMSSSVPASHISLLDDPEEGYDKVRAATTGGRETAEKQRELGGEADECPVYELYAYLLTGDDDEFAKEVYDECVGGERLCGGCKEQAAELMQEFLADHQEKREEWADKLADLDFEFDVAGARTGGD